MSRRLVSQGIVGSCIQHLGVLTRGAKAQALPPPPPVVQVAPGASGYTGTDSPSSPAECPQVASGEALPAAEAAPSDTPFFVTLPMARSWMDQLIASYESDPWFRDESDLEKLTLDEGLWRNINGRVVVPNAPHLHHKIIFALHDSPFA